MKICLLRHGETDWNKLGKLQGREDIPLNSIGIEQIKATTKYFKKYTWEAIITSPLLRAKMSAEIISKEIGNINIYEEVDFIERDYGKASGMTIDERKKIFPNGKYPGIESDEILQRRVLNGLSRSIKNNIGSDIIIVSHGAAINSMLAHFSKNEVGTGKTVLKNASITLLENKNDEVRIKYFDKIIDEIIEE
jgi:uncharacterized phosphatase